MTIEETLYALIGPALGGRFYPDVTPDTPQFPLGTYQQVGGTAGWYTDNTMPDHKQGRFQINVWAKSRLEAARIARQIEGLICASGLVAQPYGAPTALYQDALKIYGTRQDFGIWFKD